MEKMSPAWMLPFFSACTVTVPLALNAVNDLNVTP